MKLIFVREPSLYGKVISLVDGGPWTHVGIIDGEEVIEAVINAGVRIRRLDSLIRDRPLYQIIEIDFGDTEEGRRAEAEAIAWVRSQEDKPYDVWGVWGVGFGRNWEDDSKWFCSELVCETLVKAGKEFPGHIVSIGVRDCYLTACLWGKIIDGVNPFTGEKLSLA